MIVVGIDPHKKSHTAVAVCAARGVSIAQLTVPATDAGHGRLVGWILELDPGARVGLEDVREVSVRLERTLIEAGIGVVRVPPRLMGQARRSGRARGKSDPIDALALARAAIAHPDLPAARLAGPELELRLLVAHREDLVGERTRLLARLRGHLHVLGIGRQVPARALDRDCWLTPLADQLEQIAGARARIAGELVERCRELSARIDQLEREIAALAAEQAPQLLAIPGCGSLTAAKLIGEVAGIERFASAARLARYSGVAPVPACSGQALRHRLDRAGNRQLNSALYRIAITQARIHEPARAYLARRQAEGLSRREAIRCLKRHLANVVFRQMSRRKTRLASVPTPAGLGLT